MHKLINTAFLSNITLHLEIKGFSLKSCPYATKNFTLLHKIIHKVIWFDH